MDLSEYNEILKSHFGTDPKTLVNFVETCSSDELIDISVALSIALTKNTKKVTNRYDFYATSDLAAGPFPCMNLECRLRASRPLLSFAALYADTVYIPDPFSDLTYFSVHEDRELNVFDRANFLTAVVAVQQFSPLISADLISCIPSLLAMCKACAKHRKFNKKRIQKTIEKRISKIADLSYEHAEVYAGRHINSGGYYLRFSGVTELTGHSVTYKELLDKPPKELRSLFHGPKEKLIDREIVYDNKLLDDYLVEIANDLGTYLEYSEQTKLHLLTSNNTYIQGIPHARTSSSKADSNIMELLRCGMPEVQGISLSELVQIRNEDPDSFKRYRHAIQSIVSESMNQSNDNILDAAKEEIEDEIRAIEQIVRGYHAKLRSDIRKKVIFGAGTVAIGLWINSGVPVIGDLVALFGGVESFHDILHKMSDLEEVPVDAQGKRMYFLWKLKNKREISHELEGHRPRLRKLS